jgi:hypothetical protein
LAGRIRARSQKKVRKRSLVVEKRILAITTAAVILLTLIGVSFALFVSGEQSVEAIVVATVVLGGLTIGILAAMRAVIARTLRNQLESATRCMVMQPSQSRVEYDTLTVYAVRPHDGPLGGLIISVSPLGGIAIHLRQEGLQADVTVNEGDILERLWIFLELTPPAVEYVFVNGKLLWQSPANE